MAVGALHLPSGNLATTIPLPARPLHKNPALTTVKMARPFASLITETGIIVSNPFSISSLPETTWGGVLCLVFFLYIYINKNLQMNCSKIREAF